MAGIRDPLTVNLKAQTCALLSNIPSQSPYSTALVNPSSRGSLLAALSRLLSVPALTLPVATAFRPVLLDLCARWLHDDGDMEDRFVALCLLLEPHEELFPILSAFLQKPAFQNGPLAFLLSATSIQSFEASRLHRLLLAYYRILQANRRLPRDLFWPLTPLSKLFWTPYPDTGVCLLAIRCYALQTGMGEAERGKLETQNLGKDCGVDCLIEYGEDTSGRTKVIDGWIMPVIEVKRIADARNSLVTEYQEYYSVEDGELSQPIHPSELSPLIANIHGILLLRSSVHAAQASPLIATPTAIDSLRSLATYISLRLPALLTSAPSAGKSLLLSHLASVLHPANKNQLVTIHLADTSLDPRSLLGSYISSSTRPGTFEWKEGVLIRAMREGRWVVFEDIDRGSNEVLGVLKPLIESLGLGKWIGGRAALEVPSRGRVEAHEGFAVFATRSLVPSKTGKFPDPVFFGAHKFFEVVIPLPTSAELRTIVELRFARLAGSAAHGLIRLWEAVKALGSTASVRDVGLRELEKFCTRVDNLLPVSYQNMNIDSESHESVPLSTVFPNPTLREDMLLEARDVFFGGGVLTASARLHAEAIANTIGEHLGLEPDRREWVLRGCIPEFHIEKDSNGNTTAVRFGRTRLPVRLAKQMIAPPVTRPFAMHRPAVLLLSRVTTAIALGEPVLLTGETGTGKTSAVTHLASLLRRPLISLNLSHQTESSDLLGGFKPVDARIPGAILQERFLELFGATFSRRKNAQFEDSVRKAVQERKWKRAVGLWRESARLARDRIRGKQNEELHEASVRNLESETPRKRRKVDQTALNSSEAKWDAFEKEVEEFDVQHVQAKGKFAFSFVEGPLVKALRSGDWILLDEINLASPETLECISGLLRGPTASITLTEQGSLESVPRHPDFRLFACMNPATDVGKKDLPPNIRSRFTEIDVPPPDADRDTLLAIITQYIGSSAVGDKAAIMNVAEFYTAVNQLVEAREIADGSNHRPHFSMRTLARALTFASDMASTYSLRRSLWEGCLMAFTMILDLRSAKIVTTLAQKHILAGVRNPRSLLSKDPSVPKSRAAEEFVKFGPFYLERGRLPEELADDYIMTPSVETKLIDLARIVVTRRFPVLIEGPTSSGKTSSIEYLARRTGHCFVRINNHEHTDIQEYLGSYVSDPITGKLAFKDGLLVRALRVGDWIVLDELNLAPTDVLEALNRLLDDNRELVVPETNEVIRPHPHFMLFATQNPPGLYAGRKVLSRAFRNRFLEVHFEDVPQVELETILCQRCRIAPSYGQRIVAVFQELQKRRQSSRVFESKHGFATLRDLFRWAGRDAIGYQELAENGYMLLAERARREDDKLVVKEVIESIMKVRIDVKSLYDWKDPTRNSSDFLGCIIPSSSQLTWTNAMQRLFVLVSRALRFNEPVLLVGETGSGKTSVCQVYADAIRTRLHSLNCHQNTETADMIGGLRPVRNRTATESKILCEVAAVLQDLGVTDLVPNTKSMVSIIDNMLKSTNLQDSTRLALESARQKLIRLASIFQWYDGPLVEAMRNDEMFLLDEISLADDSVLERLNSVLEPERTIVLAERGGDDMEHPAIQAADGFKLIATMNPGGDYGKKELSPALRNRFTEIWVPPVDHRRDLELIIDSMWEHEPLKSYTGSLLDFMEWLCNEAGDRSLLSLRDILAWVTFSNTVYNPNNQEELTADEIFHHAAHMTFLDGLGSIPQLNAYSPEGLRRFKIEALSKLQELVPIKDTDTSLPSVPTHDPSHFIQLGSFAIPKGPQQSALQTFNLQAPTTRENAMRVVRACQVAKPILLEGSPGVGKTSLITALASLSGHHLCRINLSDQTDLMDIFGSDLPVEGGGPGDFAWRDAEFLKALQEGYWVLLDEMNLAPQAVLEGLNAILDHRGTVYIPELGRSFVRHPSFRIFAAQNPLHQGGGRKGLPKSFINRFTKVYVEELSFNDLLLVCRHVFPDHDVDVLRAMIAFNGRLNEEVVTKRSFAREGSPWEFNLRDVIRWASLAGPQTLHHPADHLRSSYLLRFRSASDRTYARALFDDVFSIPTDCLCQAPQSLMSSSSVQIGRFHASRGNFAALDRPGRVLQAHLSALESLGSSTTQGWLAIVTGRHESGKTNLVRLLANFTGNVLQEVSVNHATDTMDILGSFEQVDTRERVSSGVRRVLSLADAVFRSVAGTQLPRSGNFHVLYKALRASLDPPDAVLRAALQLLDEINVDDSLAAECQLVRAHVQDLLEVEQAAGRFEWVDGPLVDAMKQGHWLLLDGANLCNPSVLDRLNSLCETDGVLVLSERGYVDGQVQIIKPHANFRLFMCVDPRYGELSRAMRNRGVELALLGDFTTEDCKRLQDHFRMPLTISSSDDSMGNLAIKFDAARRGICLPESAPFSLDVVWPSGHVVDQDFASSVVIDGAPLLALSITQSTTESEALLYFFPRIFALANFPCLHRFLFAFHPDAESKVCQVQAIFQALGSLVGGMTLGGHTRPRSLLSSFSSTQPLEFFLTSLSDSDRDTLALRRLVLQALDLLVALVIDKGEAEATTKNWSHKKFEVTTREHTDRSERTVKEIDVLMGAIANTGRHIMEDLSTGIWQKSNTDVEVALKLLSYTRYLRRIIRSVTFDHSAVRAISGWIADQLQGFGSSFAHIVPLVKSLEDSLSLTSGLGLLDIWSTLLVHRPLHVLSSDLRQLENRVLNVSDPVAASGLRSQVFELMALQTLPALPTEDEKIALAELMHQIDMKIPESGCHEVCQPREQNDPSLMASELMILATINGFENSSITGLSMRSLQDLIHLICRNISGPLLRFISYQQMLWAVSAQKARLPILVQSHIHWLQAIWSKPSSDEIPYGPSALLHPVQLVATAQLCDWSSKWLSSSETFEAALHRQLQVIFLHCATDTSRIQQLSALLLQSILSIANCFAHSFDTGDLEMLRNISSYQLGSSNSVQHLLHFLDKTNSLPLGQAFRSILRPALEQLAMQPTGLGRISALGRCWIAFSRLILSLYVPNIPIDPAAIQSCAADFWREEERKVDSQLRLHIQFEQRMTGNSTNAVLAYLRTQISDIRERLAAMPALPNHDRHDISRLHTFWSEVSQFLTQIISPSKVDPLLEALETEGAASSMREHILQESIAGFCQRLDAVYPEYSDVTTPLRWAFLQLRLGLRLVHYAGTCVTQDVLITRTASSIIAFPAVRGAAQLCSELTSDGPSGLSTFRYLLLKISAVVFQVSLGAGISSHGKLIETTYEQILRLWLIDRAREEEAERDAQSLYRRNALDHDAAGDAEIEEREFLELFPDFEDAIEQEGRADTKDGHRTALVDSSQVQELTVLHHLLMDYSFGDSALSSEPRFNFHDTRKRAIGLLLESQAMSLPDIMDIESLPFQSSLLHDRLSESRNGVNSRTSPYDFYSDANIVEVKKAAVVVEALSLRLKALIEEWPDQMVLQHLKGRCEAILRQGLHSPVAKILTALEQLLTQSEDWEMYANRENTLNLHRQALIELIVNWRRLELSCWQVLLQSQAQAFADASSDSWFYLYNSSIRGSLDAAEDTSGTLEVYLQDLIPLLDEFICSSPLGQYDARMRLMRDFERYICYLISNKTGPHRQALQRVQRIFHATSAYYKLFSVQLSIYLQEQRTLLEKEIRGFIKLASWKDVNVYALKQSAQRTHHHLYKIIRKFREVLRQSIQNRLQPELAGDWECKYLESSSSRRLDAFFKAPSFPEGNFDETSPLHLSDLTRVFMRFDTFITTRIRKFVDSHPAHIIDNASVDIITTARSLASISISKDIPLEKREKQRAALLVRKRKALSDLFKELKRAGFAANVKPEVLRQQRDQVWIREQPLVLCIGDGPISVAKGENYFNRLKGCLHGLRERFSTHHSDLNTREIQRGLMLLESAFSVALNARSCLARVFDNYGKLKQFHERLQAMKSSTRVVASGIHLRAYLDGTTDMLCKLTNALDDVVQALNLFDTLKNSGGISTSVLSIAASTKDFRDRLVAVASQVRLTDFPILLENEHLLIIEVISHVSQTSASLSRWSEEFPELKHIFHPVQLWLGAETISMPALENTVSPAAMDNCANPIIDVLLVNVQSMLGKCSDLTDEHVFDEADNYMRNGSRLMCDFTEMLGLGALLDRLHSALPQLAASTDEILENSLQRFLPFLERYMNLAEQQLVSQSQWVNALFKLVFILCSVMHTLVKDGFCQPPDGEEADSGGDITTATDGVGLGEGTGTENVSKEIEDESQVEGLQGEDTDAAQPKDNGGEDNAIEMSEEFGGEMEDIPDPGSAEDDEPDEGSEADPEERAEKLDAADPSAVDEKLWGDEQGPQESNNTQSKTTQDHSEEKSKDSDVVAKEQGVESQSKRDKQEEISNGEDPEPPAPDAEPMLEDLSEDGAHDEDPGLSGAPMDDYVQEANTLDLPDDIDLGQGEDMQDDQQMEEDEDRDDMSVDEPGLDFPEDEDERHNDADDSPVKDTVEPTDEVHDQERENQPTALPEDGDEREDVPNEKPDESSIAQPDVSRGEGTSASDEPQNPEQGESASTGQKGSVDGAFGKDQEDRMQEQADQGLLEASQAPAEAQTDESQGAGTVDKGSQQGRLPSQPETQLSNNPLRSLGDALKEIHQRFEDILDHKEGADAPQERPGETADISQLEYLRPDDVDHDMQALGSAGEEQVAKLNDLRIIEDDQLAADPSAPMNIDFPAEPTHHERPSQVPPPGVEPTTQAMDHDIEGAITQHDVRAQHPGDSRLAGDDVSTVKAEADMEDIQDAEVEAELRRWQAEGLPDDGAEHIWRLYESLTHDLAYALCEQLRLILEPTLATRLKGDYRTGKRLNMKKIISYIASDYTKDKIWLRRTRPSQREYQVLIALDDSRSMAESHSVHLAFETLALVSKALSRLEVGDIAITKFGESVEVLHGFDEGPFTDQAGTKIMNAFHFNQKATNVLSLLETSLKMLETAREHRSMGSTSAADLWQLQMIISDGICQDHDRLRTVLRKAEEQRVMIVFIVIDSLHSTTTDSAMTSDSGAMQNSILSMKQVAWKNVNGAMDMQLERYLDSFPFEYYLVLRNVEALPEVLSGTLKQFFERISEE